MIGDNFCSRSPGGCSTVSFTIVCRQGRRFVMLLEWIRRGDAAGCREATGRSGVAHRIDEHDIHVSLSIGISIYPDHGADPTHDAERRRSDVSKNLRGTQAYLFSDKAIAGNRAGGRVKCFRVRRFRTAACSAMCASVPSSPATKGDGWPGHALRIAMCASVPIRQAFFLILISRRHHRSSGRRWKQRDLFFPTKEIQS